MLHSGILRTAVFFGLSGVILGAFAAHGLHDKISPVLLEAWKTGVQYQFYHTFVLLFICLAGNTWAEKQLIRASWFFIAGIVLFSGSLYLLAIASLFNLNLMKIGILTPLGGLFFMAGWVQLFFLRKK